jgi:hypothetical protein
MERFEIRIWTKWDNHLSIAHTSLIAAIWLKRCYKIPVAVFIPDLPMHTSGEELRGFRAFVRNANNRLLKQLVAKLDLAFPITKEMAKDWLPSSIRYRVIEGIAPTCVARGTPIKSEPNKIPVILYTGQFSYTLKFVKLFTSLPRIDAKLVFIGRGPDEGELKAIADNDSRFVVRPFVTGEAFEQEFAAADFLLNPRDTSWDGGRYSFPSKLFDYMTRGRPILSTPIAGIPEEYFDCFIEICDDNLEGFATSLERAIASSPAELERRVIIGETMLATSKSAKAVIGKVLEAMSA